MRNLVKIMLALFVLVAGAADGVAKDKPSLNGVALVIGQSKYDHITSLPNPANDARDMLKLLTDLGFDARSVTDRDTKKLKRDLERFAEDAEGADVALLYYSGHGLESDGENWLVPVDADMSSLENANEYLIGVSALIDDIKAKVPVSIVLLDACRTNPFPPGALVKRSPGASGTPVSTGGLTPVRGAVALSSDNPSTENFGAVVGFAAEPGRPALDGDPGANSPYASALLRHLGAIDGEEFGAVMRMVTEEVYLDTGARQRPWTNESLRRFLYFGVPAEKPQGDEGVITGERRKLLLTISELPDARRAEVRTVAAKSDVPLDSMFGVLRALGAEIPSDPEQLEKVLDQQAGRLKEMMAQKNALDSKDPEIARLTASADEAIRQGALEAARAFLDKAVARVEETRATVDDAEEEIRRKRIADAAVYARRADARLLTFDFAAAADDYDEASQLVSKWDETLSWNYRNKLAESLQAAGQASGDDDMLRRAIGTYESLLADVPDNGSQRDAAITSNNMAVVYQTIGERESTSENLEKSVALFTGSLAVFEKEKDDVNWAAAQTNMGNALMKIGERESNPARLREAIARFRLAIAKRDRKKTPLDWASSQNNIGIASFKLYERTGDLEALANAEKAYRLSLEEYRKEANPMQWALVQNNMGNTLGGIAITRNDPAMHEQAAAAFRAALEVRTREQFPLQYGASMLNLGNTLYSYAQMTGDTGKMQEAVDTYRDALTVLTRDVAPMDWASVQHNMGVVLQTIGQLTMNPAKLAEAAEAVESSMQEFTREKLPLDWAMAQNSRGNIFLTLGRLQQNPETIGKASNSFRSALEVYTRDQNPKLWAIAQNSLASSLQSLAFYDSTTASIKASIEARRAALEVISFENSPTEWATAEDSLGMALLNLNNFERNPELLKQANEALQQALRVFKRESMPAQWAGTINNIGDVHWSMATGGGDRKQNFEQAIDRYEEAKEGFTVAGHAQFVALLDQKINLIRQALATKP